MTAWDKIKDLFARGLHSKPAPRTFAMIRPDRAPDRFGGHRLLPNECYVRISVARMQLTYDRVLYKDYYPVVHSFVELSREGAGNPVVPFVVGPANLAELSQSHENQILIQNVPILSETPYIGSDVKLALALCATQSNDYLKNLLDILGSMSKIVGGVSLTTAMTVIEPLKSGAESLLGLNEKVTMKIGLINTFKQATSDLMTNSAEDALLDGYYALVNIRESENFGNWLHFHDGQLLVECAGQKYLPVTADHIVFQISQTPKMESWSRIAGLNDAKLKVFNAGLATGAESADYKEAVIAFKQLVVANADLVQADRIAIIRGLDKMVSDILNGRAPLEPQGKEDVDAALAEMAELGRRG